MCFLVFRFFVLVTVEQLINIAVAVMIAMQSLISVNYCITVVTLVL